MSESSGEGISSVLSRLKSYIKNPDAKISRRTAATVMGTAVATPIGAALVADAISPGRTSDTKPAPLAAGQKDQWYKEPVAKSKAAAPVLVPTVAPTATPLRVVEMPTKEPYEQKNHPKVVDPEVARINEEGAIALTEEDLSVIFTSCDGPQERQTAIERVGRSIRRFIKQHGIERSVDKTYEWVPLVNNVCRMFGDAVDPRLRSIMPGLIFAESKGDRFAHAQRIVTEWNPVTKQEEVVKVESIAEGLAQIKQSTAMEEYESLPQGLKNHVVFRTNDLTGEKLIDLLDPGTNIILSTKHLNRLLKVYPDPAIAVWAYHFGQGNINNLVYDYAEHHKIPFDKSVTFMMKSANLTYDKLMQWFGAHMERLEYKQEKLDSTQIYTSNVEAGGWLLRHRDEVMRYRKRVDSKGR